MDSIIICGCVLNCEPYLPCVFENIDRIATCFQRVEIIICYDEGTDGSVEWLNKEKKNRSNLHCFPNREPKDTYHRTANLANARNQLLDVVESSFAHFPYMIMMDMDDVCAMPISLDVFLQAFEQREHWDSVSFARTGGYYDTWALSIDDLIVSRMNVNDSLLPMRVSQIWEDYIHWKLMECEPNSLVKCYSAFNGLAIYNIAKCVVGCRYDWKTTSVMALITEEQKMKTVERVLGLCGCEHPNPQFFFVKLNTSADCEHRHFHFQSTFGEQCARHRILNANLF